MGDMIDKYGILNRLSDISPVVLELGCGPRKRHIGSLGIDALNYPTVDIVGDALEVLRRLPTNSVDQVYSCHFVEHVDNVKGLLLEISRVLKQNGLVEFVTPHFSNPYFYSDPTHRNHFGLYTFCYYSVGTLFRRKVPVYEKEYSFKLESVDLIFKSARPFYVRYGIKSLIGKIFNSSYFMKELYEENFCYVFPCYEIRYRLIRVPTVKGNV